MHAGIFASPSEPENTHDKQQPTKHGTEETLFGWRETTPTLDQIGVMACEVYVDCCTRSAPNPNANKDKPSLRNCKTTLDHKDDRERLEDYAER
jgi:hypothetical protein